MITTGIQKYDYESEGSFEVCRGRCKQVNFCYQGYIQFCFKVNVSAKLNAPLIIYFLFILICIFEDYVTFRNLRTDAHNHIL